MKKTSDVSKIQEEIGELLAKPTLTEEESKKVTLLIGKLGEKGDGLVRGKR